MTAQADRVRARWWWLAGLCGAAAFGGLLVFPVLAPDPWLERFDKLSSVGGLVVAVAGLAVSVWSVMRASRAPAAEPAALLEQAASGLAVQVRRQWRAELDARGMGHLDPIRLRWSATDRPVMPSPAEVIGVDQLPPPPARVTRLRLAGDIDDMVRTLARLPSRQLVVIGAPGAGKSTLAVLLTLGLLARWRAGDPVPVLLTLTSWDPGREHLDTWLARRLAESYPGLASRGGHGPGTAAQLVRTGLVLPVLDGLDEMPEALHAPAVTALTAAVGRDRPLVLTSRAEEYQSAVRRAEGPLARAAVVEVEPVTAADAVAYLPAAYARRAPPPPRTGRAGGAVRPSHPPQQAQQWLAFLAAHLTRENTTDLAWWRLHRAVPRFGLKAGLAYALLVGSAIGFVSWLQLGSAAVVVGPAGALVGGLAIGLMVGFAGERVYATPQRLRVRAKGFAAGSAAGFVSGLASWLLLGLGLVPGVAFGCAAGLMCGLMFGLGAPATFAHAVTTPVSALRDDRSVSCLLGALVGLPSGGITRLASGLLDGTPSALLVGSVFGLAASYVAGAWPSFVVARALLAARGRLPHDLMRFLEDAYRRGVLRRAGAVYQFRHARLQQHLATAHAGATTTSRDHRQ